jgi:hypothetical protein
MMSRENNGTNEVKASDDINTRDNYGRVQDGARSRDEGQSSESELRGSGNGRGSQRIPEEAPLPNSPKVQGV